MTYSPEEINQKLAAHPDWSLGDDGQLHMNVTLGNFKEIVMFANAVALLAETANHHPDILMHGYKNLRISVMTHDQDGITDKDFELVAAIDNLPRFG
ncbi:MAG: 4a-hydroxytetrahydrobiopterin dehydratase [Chloroflexi bacterium]|nr:4a-hydroxytetrahydrobiopterin dehydratase [Chloroflexota bacterium]